MWRKRMYALCYGALRCVAVCCMAVKLQGAQDVAQTHVCSVLLCVAVCCRALHCVVWKLSSKGLEMLRKRTYAVCYFVLQRVAVRCMAFEQQGF